MFFKRVHKVAIYLGYFGKNIGRPDPSKRAQSGHTASYLKERHNFVYIDNGRPQKIFEPFCFSFERAFQVANREAFLWTFCIQSALNDFEFGLYYLREHVNIYL